MGSEMCIRDSCIDPASAAAAPSAAASVAASKHFLVLHGAAAAAESARTIGAKFFILAATAPCSSRWNLALVVAVELTLPRWPGVMEIPRRQDLKPVGPATIWNKSFVCFFFCFFLLDLGRKGQRKNEGADSSGCRGAQGRPQSCLLLHSATCCFCSLLLLLLQVGSAGARQRPSCR